MLCCTPTYAIRLAEAAAEEGIDLTRVQVRTHDRRGRTGRQHSGDAGSHRKLWPGARVVDHHGMTEIGPVSYGCPKRERRAACDRVLLHRRSDRSRDRRARRSHGELVLTNLGRLGSPLIRYRTGDMVQRATDAQCECGTLGSGARRRNPRAHRRYGRRARRQRVSQRDRRRFCVAATASRNIAWKFARIAR